MREVMQERIVVARVVALLIMSPDSGRGDLFTISSRSLSLDASASAFMDRLWRGPGSDIVLRISRAEPNRPSRSATLGQD